jgi:hypothetical protein
MVHYNNEGKITTDASPPGDNLSNVPPVMDVGRVELPQTTVVVPQTVNEHQFNLIIIDDTVLPIRGMFRCRVTNTFSTTHALLLSSKEVEWQIRGMSWSSVVIIGITEYELQTRYAEVYQAVKHATVVSGAEILEIA